MKKMATLLIVALMLVCSVPLSCSFIENTDATSSEQTGCYVNIKNISKEQSDTLYREDTIYNEFTYVMGSDSATINFSSSNSSLKSINFNSFSKESVFLDYCEMGKTKQFIDVFSMEIKELDLVFAMVESGVPIVTEPAMENGHRVLKSLFGDSTYTVGREASIKGNISVTHAVYYDKYSFEENKDNKYYRSGNITKICSELNYDLTYNIEGVEFRIVQEIKYITKFDLSYNYQAEDKRDVDTGTLYSTKCNSCEKRYLSTQSLTVASKTYDDKIEYNTTDESKDELEKEVGRCTLVDSSYFHLGNIYNYRNEIDLYDRDNDDARAINAMRNVGADYSTDRGVLESKADKITDSIVFGSNDNGSDNLPVIITMVVIVALVVAGLMAYYVIRKRKG